MENKPTSNKPNRRKIIIAIVVFIVFIAGIYRFVVSSDMNEENSDWVNKIIIWTFILFIYQMKNGLVFFKNLNFYTASIRRKILLEKKMRQF